MCDPQIMGKARALSYAKGMGQYVALWSGLFPSRTVSLPWAPRPFDILCVLFADTAGTHRKKNTCPVIACAPAPPAQYASSNEHNSAYIHVKALKLLLLAPWGPLECKQKTKFEYC